MVATDWNNFGPRFGIAYSPSSKWSIRAGFGVFFSQETANSKFDVNRSSAGRLTDLPDPRAVPTLSYANSYDPTQLPYKFNPGLTWAIQHDIATPYSMMFLFNIQRQIGNNTTLEVGYNGALHRHLQNQNNGDGLLPYNAPGVAPGTNVAPADRPPYREYAAGIELTEGGGRPVSELRRAPG